MSVLIHEVHEQLTLCIPQRMTANAWESVQLPTSLPLPLLLLQAKPTFLRTTRPRGVLAPTSYADLHPLGTVSPKLAP
jgi:hypothetical protein